jgi:histidine kinase/DNA gyrase B/HSP90-like ATPase
MGETRVDLLHLLEDLRDAYPGPLEETILTELVANSLDSGATLISAATNLGQAELILTDNGSGMKPPELRRYHDIAASNKVRGEGIGFAGVGVKLSLLACHDVLTETRRGKSHVASLWHLASRHRAPWKRLPPPGLIAEHGTAVRLHLKNPFSPLLDAGFVEAALERHYAPLFDPDFAEFLRTRYPHGVRFVLNGRVIAQPVREPDRVSISIRMRRKRKPEGIGYLLRSTHSSEESGLAISTLGKVIRRGWDWLGVFPSRPDEVGGLIEIPALATCLTLSKTEFVRSGPRGAMFLQYRKALQEVLSAQLNAWGDKRDKVEEEQRRRIRPLERDLEKLLVDLAEDFPLLASLVERRSGGQRQLPVGGPGRGNGKSLPLSAHELIGSSPMEISTDVLPETPTSIPQPCPPDRRTGPEPTEKSLTKGGGVVEPRQARRRRAGHYRLTVELEYSPKDPQIARLLESTVRVNSAHPTYRRADASRSLGYHLALAAAMALAPLAVEADQAHDFITAFLTWWGRAVDHLRARPSGRRERPKPPTL